MASTTTYLTLVNNSIIECGASMSSYAADGSDFTTITETLPTRMKTWVSRAWKDIQQDCYDWEFMDEQGLCNLTPGVMFYTDGTPVSIFSAGLANSTVQIYDQDGTIAIPNVQISNIVDLTGTSTLTLPFGYFNFGPLTAQTPLNIALKPGAEYVQLQQVQIASGGTFTGSIPAVPTTVDIDITTATGTTSYPASAQLIGSSNPPFFYTITTYNPAVTTAYKSAATTQTTLYYPNKASATFTAIDTNPPAAHSVVLLSSVLKAFIHSWKSFDFDEETQVGDFQEVIQEIDPTSFRMIDYNAPPPQGEVPINNIPWESFRSAYDQSAGYPGLPRIISEDDTGRWRLYPHPYYQVSMKFDYVRLPQILTAFGDIPRGITDDFMDIIMWKALMYYGEYDEQPSVLARATKQYSNLLARLGQKSKPKFTLTPRRLY